ncbi:transcriptional activator NhaR [Ectothiorhodospiraceae bacterium BW-2]|nr:transcriptional activator NhaR [Ectothiorhodospiraceae bacterium BW-2]
MINYKHLYYFWCVARDGTISRASERLHLTPQTISGQISLLEEQLGEPLFTRTGRQLQLTDSGRFALGYANEIFSLGSELEQILRHPPSQTRLPFRVGIADVVPKSIAYRLLAPAFAFDKPIKLICREGSVEPLLAELALHRLDLVIADSPLPSSVSIRGYTHPLGHSGISFMATPALAQQLSTPFPQLLDRQPMMLPGKSTAIRSRLTEWFERHHLLPQIVAEFDDSALMKAFGRAGNGIFITPTVIATEVEQQFDAVTLGQTTEVEEHYYAISIERKITHPAIALITTTARQWLTSHQCQ